MLGTSLLLIAALQAPQPRYAAGAYRYELVTELAQKQEMMGASTESSMRLVQRITVGITQRHADTLGLTIIIDSVHIDVGQVVPDSLLAGVRGMTVTGAMSPRGRIYELAAAVDSMAHLADDFRSFFPPLPPTLAVGTSWTDTMAVDVNPAGLSMGRMTVAIAGHVAADTVYGGARAWKIVRTSSGSGGGTSSESGTRTTFAVTSTGTGTAFVDRSGVYLGGASTSESVATVTIPDHNLTVPVTATGTSRVRLLRTP